MFSHVSYDVSDLKKSSEFFEKALAPLGHKKLVDMPEYGMAGFGTEHPELWIGKGNDRVNQKFKDEVHFCFTAKSRKQVDEFYAAAIAAGGTDNGKPGIRAEYGPNYYAAFVFDLDGINLEAACTSEN